MKEPKAGQSSSADETGARQPAVTVRFWDWVVEDIPWNFILGLLVGVVIGAALCYFWLSRQSFWLEPLIGYAVHATVIAQPTTTPTATGTPTSTVTPTATGTPTSTVTPTPVPQARIVEPDYLKGPVPVRSTVVVDYRDIPADRYLWVVVRVPKVAPAWRVFPQLLDGRLPTPVVGGGTLRLSVQFGNPEMDTGEPFNVVVLLLDAAVHRVFTEYAEGCIGGQNCPGIELPAAGAEMLDFNTVVRQ
jgi:hypothetical protein